MGISFVKLFSILLLCILYIILFSPSWPILASDFEFKISILNHYATVPHRLFPLKFVKYLNVLNSKMNFLFFFPD